MTDYDVIIIGSGIGGTGVGALLASKGFKTLLIEKNEFIGGRCSCYEKEGFKIDIGVHLFARTSKGPLTTILKSIGMEDAIDWVLVRKPGPKWYYQEKLWSFPRELQTLVPESDYSNIMKLLRDVIRIKDTRELDTVSFKSWLSNYSNNTLIHSFFSTVSSLYFVEPYYNVSAGEFVRCLSSLTKHLSVGYPRGGCLSIPLAYIQGIRKFKGEVKTGLLVKKIIIENETVQGVELDNGDFISSKIVISNAGIRETVNSLVGRIYFNKNYLEKIDKLKYSLSALCFKIALKKPITHYKMICAFSSEDPEKRVKSILDGKVPDEVDLFIPVPSNFDPNLAPKGKQLIIAGTFVPREYFEINRSRWINTSMKRLQKIFPELSENLLWIDVTTPKDIELMAGKEASVIGISQTTEQAGINRPSSILPIEGLYLVGGDAGGWGIGTELASQSAIECAEIILSKIKKIKT